MCQLHPRLFKKYREMLDVINARIQHEGTEREVQEIKAIKLKASEEFRTIKECLRIQQIESTIKSPTPTARNTGLLRVHVETLLKVLRG